ncbi:MAG: hypothetical protein JO081_00005, partial [Alphaproteobacteria bacterium]|nr:hypothetical protein [Alphaproteobacteria bacterium]
MGGDRRGVVAKAPGIADEARVALQVERVRVVRWRRWRREPRAEPFVAEGSLVALAVLALVAGAGSGLIVAMFRLALVDADRWREMLIARAYHQPVIGFVLVVAGC